MSPFVVSWFQIWCYRENLQSKFLQLLLIFTLVTTVTSASKKEKYLGFSKFTSLSCPVTKTLTAGPPISLLTQMSVQDTFLFSRSTAQHKFCMWKMWILQLNLFVCESAFTNPFITTLQLQILFAPHYGWDMLWTFSNIWSITDEHTPYGAGT